MSPKNIVISVRHPQSKWGRFPPSRTERNQSGGFTLIELIVCSSIATVLLAIFLPAMMNVRESARRTVCSNNLRQIGVALHHYHHTNECLPIGCIEWRGWQSPPNYRQYAWSATLLPYIEQQSLHDQIDWSIPFDAPQNGAAANATVSTYLCPSDTQGSLLKGSTTYGGLFGERILNNYSEDGLFLYERATRFKEILDGLSNTLAVAEDSGGPDRQWINGRNVFVVAHGINDTSAWTGDNEVRSKHPGGAMGLFIDGRAAFLTDSTEKNLLGSWVTRAGGEITRTP